MELALGSVTLARGRAPDRVPEKRAEYVAANDDRVVPHPSGPKLIVVRHVSGTSRVFHLGRSLLLRAEYERLGVHVSHPTLPVQGFGCSLMDALSEFGEMFQFQYEGLVECDELELSEKARRARAALESLVERVEDLA